MMQADETARLASLYTKSVRDQAGAASILHGEG